jgi:hypothetical protein
MATMVIEYNGRNKTVKQVIDGLLSAGIIRRKSAKREKHIEELKQAILETEKMVEDIRLNGIKGYKTLEELVAED